MSDTNTTKIETPSPVQTPAARKDTVRYIPSANRQRTYQQSQLNAANERRRRQLAGETEYQS